MISKISKIILKTWEKYFIFVFLAVFLGIFSYILWINIVLSVKDYLQDQIKPIVWGDIVLLNRTDLDEEKFRKNYENTFYIAKTIEINSTLFDRNKKPNLVELVYHTPNYPFYNQFEYDIINQSWTLIVKQNTLENYWNNINILWENYEVKWIIKKTPFSDINIYTGQNKIYLPIENFPKNLNSTNSRLDYKYYLIFKWKYDEKYKEILQSDPILKDFRITTLNDRNDNIWDITDRFYLFIIFFNLVVFTLAFFIVILSIENFFKKIKTKIGLLNIFWMKKNQIFYYNFLVLFILFILSFFLAYFFSIILMKILFLKYDFFSLKFESFYKWFFITIVLFLVWLFLPIYKIFKSDILSLIKDEGSFSNFLLKDYIIYSWLIFLGFLWVSLISGISFGSSFFYSFWFILFIIIFYILIEKILQFRNKNFQFLRKLNFYFFDAIRSTIKPGNVSFLIIFSRIISFSSIFIFYIFSWSFLNYLNNITKNSNDTFVINVQQKDLAKIEKFFSSEEIYEIISLKIKAINGKNLKEYLWVEKVSMKFGREFFSTTKSLDNKILSWEKLFIWWVSVDIEFAKELWLNIWDKITFSFAGFEKTLKVINFREAVRNGTDPFFFFQVDSRDFLKYPKNYILSYKESEKPKNIENILHNEVWSHLTFIKTKEIIEIIISIAKKILVVVYFCLAYIFIFSFLSFIVSISFLSTFKINKLKLLNILWGNKRKLINAFNFEFSYLIFIGLLLSFVFWSLILLFISYFIKYFVLDLVSFLIWNLIIFWLFLIMFFYLKIFQRKSI